MKRMVAEMSDAEYSDWLKDCGLAEDDNGDESGSGKQQKPKSFTITEQDIIAWAKATNNL